MGDGSPIRLDILTRPDETGFGPDFDAEYAALPEGVKMLYTPKEYAWLGARRHMVVEEETMPEAFDD